MGLFREYRNLKSKQMMFSDISHGKVALFTLKRFMVNMFYTIFIDMFR